MTTLDHVNSLSNTKCDNVIMVVAEAVFEPLSKVKDLSHGPAKTELSLNSEWKSRLYPEVNEMYFFHGTKPDNVDAVCSQGLDVKMSAGQAVFGQAIYMAESSTKADQYTGSIY